jgi:hypothetical protein
MIYLIWGVRFKYQISTIWGLPPQLINHNKPAFVSPGLTLAWVSKNGIIAFCSRKHGYYKMDLARKNAKFMALPTKMGNVTGKDIGLSANKYPVVNHH